MNHKPQLNPDILGRLKTLTNAEIGIIADIVMVQPQTVSKAIQNNSPKLATDLLYLQAIIKVLNLKVSSLAEITNLEPITLPFEIE